MFFRSLKFPFIILLCFWLGVWFGSYMREAMTPPLNSQNRHFEKDWTRKTLAQHTDKGRIKENVFFLKTHKTASTVVQNVILRYADHHGLLVGAPAFNDHKFGYSAGKTFHHNQLRKSQHKISILCHHMRFNYEEVKMVMPTQTVFVTIIRDPASLFESFFDYFHWDCDSFARVPHTELGMRLWLNNTKKYFKGRNDKPLWWFAKNGLFYDFGFDNLNESEFYIQNSIEKVEQMFELVLIADYLEESLILLKDLLQWSLKDVAFLRLNSRLLRTVLDENLRSRISEWNKADSLLFQHFNRTFWKKVKKYGLSRMSQEVVRLKEINSQLRRSCIRGDGPVAGSDVDDVRFKVFSPKGVKMASYNLREDAKFNKTCRDLVLPERHWLRYLMTKQYGGA